MTDVQRTDFQSRYAKDEVRFGVTRQAVTELPIIDVSSLVAPSSEVDRLQTASEIRKACIDSGFFLITGYGVPDAEMQKVKDLAIRFFGLPEEVKARAHPPEFIAGRGYQPMDSERITPGCEPDYKEYYDFGLELDDADLSPIDRGTTFWPVEDALPGFQAAMRAHVKRMLAIGQSMMRGFALSLDLPEHFFDEAHRTPFFNFRPSFYPPATDVLAANKWSCGPHTDYMSMTMLWQDEVGGLEVMNLDGDWIVAPPRPDTMVLNIADMMSIWTNDLYTSNPHRVANRSPDRHRLSLAHFIGPGPTTQVDCLPTCRSASNPPRYEPTTTTQHITNIMAKALDPEFMKNAEVKNAEVTERLRGVERIGA